MFQASGISFKDLPFKQLLNETIFILRGLFLKNKNPKLWTDVVLKLEHHTNVRKEKADCVEKDRKVIANLNEIKKQLENQIEDEFSWFHVDESEVIQISGIINVNAFSSTKLEDECRSRRVRRRVT
jgi:hypothetical protein